MSDYTPSVPAITIAELKKNISENSYYNVTGRSDAVAENAITIAKDWVAIKYDRAGVDLDFDADYIAARAALNYAIYFLYLRHENEEVAADKRAAAIDLLFSKLGNYALDVTGPQSAKMLENEGGDSVGVTAIVVDPGTADYHGFGGFADWEDDEY
ncbi:MAG: hypothetical protein PF495_18100 [Spirochaetales bacterium]|jgi:hypothetical protein|nr:hypothetical protein [Spirochaetales bacterium]